MRLIDIHAHLTFKSFKKDLDDVIRRAKENGIIAIIDSGIDPDDSRKALNLSKKYSRVVFTSIGLAPQIADEEKFTQTLKLLEQHKGEYLAVGEIGLDYYWIRDDKKRQACKRYFSVLLSFAISNNLPVVIHNRDATKDVIRILDEHGAEKVVFHAFMGTLNEAWDIIKRGWFISIPTIIVRSEHHQKLVKKIPLEHIMLETDSPFLAPKPRTRNEPANVRLSVEIISKIKGISQEKLSEIIFKNTTEFFAINFNP